jgi:hypothetical protein
MSDVFKKMFFCSLCLLSLTVAAQQSTPSLWIYAPDNSEKSFELEDIGKITFSSDAVQINLLSSANTSILFSDIAVMTFTRKAETGIENLTIDNIKVYMPDINSIMIESANAIESVMIYNLQGGVVGSKYTLSGQSLSVQVPLTGCPKGIYIVKTKTKAGVFVKKIIKNK